MTFVGLSLWVSGTVHEQAERAAAAERRRAEARRLAQAQQAVLSAEADAEQLRSAADRDARTAAERTAERDAAAVDLAQAWRAWTGDPRASELLGDIEWAAHPAVGPLILDAEALVGEAEGELHGLDQVAAEAAQPAQGKLRPNEHGSTRPMKTAASSGRRVSPSVPTWSPNATASPTTRPG
jgi:hypothetical protein